jgi:hypothetical protein
MSPKYIAGPINSRLNARFIPHMGNRVPLGIVITASTNLRREAFEKDFLFFGKQATYIF